MLQRGGAESWLGAGVTRSDAFAWLCVGAGYTDPAVPLWAALLLASFYVASLVFSRLYLGAHSPTDIRGGDETQLL